ncbi:uncharacterized protein LOC116603049 isoform X3 [Nematostella vectensis]|uniref:uncharacterized protein LOC116603049 isoform X3 n=1 Tax=Nematostella vectensis TaxID=45351 RepID=UPI0020778893|nr:uncharacterized protein LOC116603049 isoform X3 [Nematostella vectensis]
MAELGEDFDGLVKLERYRLTKEALVTYRPFLVIFAVVLTVVALLQIAIGAIYLGDCPAQPMIPIYLIGVGAGIVLTGIVGRTCPCLDKKYRPRNPILYVLLLFLIGWFMAGNIWVFRLYLPDMEHKHDTARFKGKNLAKPAVLWDVPGFQGETRQKTLHVRANHRLWQHR